MDTKSPSEHADAKAAQARLEAAKESLTSRLEELGRRFTSTKETIEHKLDVREHIAAHPWPAVGIAFAVGALAGFIGGKKTTKPIEAEEKKTLQSRLGEAVVAAIGTVAIKLVREAAFGQLKDSAKRWIDERRGYMAEEPSAPAYVER